jgi:phage shock protein A
MPVFTEEDRAILVEVLQVARETTLQLDRMEKQMTATDDVVKALQDDEVGLKAELGKLSAQVSGFTAQLAAATAAASAAGATPTQLQALTDLHTALQADVATVQQAEAAAPPT